MEYFKKIIVGSTLAEVDSFFKHYVLTTKESLINVEKETVLSIASKILLASKSFTDFRLLDNSESNLLFYAFLKEKSNDEMIYDLIPRESFSFDTSKNAYEAIKQVRTGKLIKQDHKLKNIIDLFESFLIKRNCLDEPLILSNALKIFDEEIGNIYRNEVVFFELESIKGKLTYLESELLNKIKNHFKFDNSLFSEIKSSNAVKQYKVKTHGYTNEIKYIIKTIKENNLNLGDVAIYSTSNAYNNLIKSYFENHKINYYFANGENISNSDFIGFFYKVLDFIGNNYDLTALSFILRSPVLAYYDDGEVKASYSILDQIRDLKPDKKNILKKAENLPLYKKDFVNELVSLNDDKCSISELYKNVLNFSIKYTLQLSHKYCDALLKLESLFALLDDSKLRYDEKLNLISNIIGSITASSDKKPESGSYVLIDSLNAKYLSRKYNFFIGLSSSELTVSEIESPLLSDAELNEIVDDKNYYVKKAKNKNKELYERIEKLFKTQVEGSQCFITSVYDSVSFKLLSKSPLYLNMPNEAQTVYFEDEEISDESIEQQKNYVFPQTKDNISKVDNNILSPSKIETLIGCPLKYIYSLIYDDLSINEKGSKWLVGGEEGTFAHGILEYYFRFVKKDSFDELLFEQACKKVFEVTDEQNPFSNKAIQEVEFERIKRFVKKYLNKYYKEHSPYKPIYCELNIKKELSVAYPDIPNFKVHGIIDRVDAYVGLGQQLKIRIIDYKTYSESSFDTHRKNNLLTQIILYPLMIVDYVNNHIDEVKNKVGDFKVSKSYDVDFVYEALKLDKIKPIDVNAIKGAIDESLMAFDLFRKDPTWDNFLTIYNPTIASKSNFTEGKCGYCPFKDYCKLKTEKGESQVWMK